MIEKRQIKKIKKGSKKAFIRLYKSYKNEIFAYFLLRVKNREDALDLTSLCFEKVLRYIESYNKKWSVRTWIYKIARNLLFDYLNQKKKENSISMDMDQFKFQDMNNSTKSTDKNTTHTLYTILSKLPKRYSEILKSRYLLNMSQKEIAQAFEISENNAKVLLFRALKKAKKIKQNVTLKGIYK